jgi:actin-related protein
VIGLLELAKKLPLDVRAAMLTNVFLVGGTAMIPGLPQRVVDELRDALENDNEYSSLASSILAKATGEETADLMPTYFPRNMVSWIGGSIFAATESARSMSMSAQEYVAKGHRLPDWLSVGEN